MPVLFAARARLVWKRCTKHAKCLKSHVAFVLAKKTEEPLVIALVDVEHPDQLLVVAG